ncbi:MAG: DUF1540 domain-containing protein [Frankia sp.]|jgi:hypothetical protein|nr:DUF1540 domain-containing protein [Frankia sp.]
MQLPVITKCVVDACAYNRSQTCHAPAITVGDTGAMVAHCDTFLVAPTKGGDPSTTGQVGACKVSDCTHNESFTCHAPGITVGFNMNGVDCLTYQSQS